MDIHLNSDTTCGTYKPGMTGYAGTYPGPGRGYVCLFDVEKENRWLAFTPENAVKIEDQLLSIHEYAHVIFFGRHEASYEDVVKAVSFYISEPRRNPCDESLNQLDQGMLIYQLCQRNGFRYDHLAPSLIELDQLYQAGLGQLDFGWSHPTTSLYQYRLILDKMLGGDTYQAFLSVGYSPLMLGDGAVMTPGGGTVSLAGGYLTLVVPPDAVAENISITMLMLHQAPQEPANQRFTFQLSCDLKPGDTSFSRPVQLTLRYDPMLLLQPDEWIPSGEVQESSLRLYKVINNGWQQVDGSSVDTVNKTVTGSVTSLGQYGILGSAGP